MAYLLENVSCLQREASVEEGVGRGVLFRLVV